MSKLSKLSMSKLRMSNQELGISKLSMSKRSMSKLSVRKLRMSTVSICKPAKQVKHDLSNAVSVSKLRKLSYA